MTRGFYYENLKFEIFGVAFFIPLNDKHIKNYNNLTIPNKTKIRTQCQSKRGNMKPFLGQWWARPISNVLKKVLKLKCFAIIVSREMVEVNTNVKNFYENCTLARTAYYVAL